MIVTTGGLYAHFDQNGNIGSANKLASASGEQGVEPAKRILRICDSHRFHGIFISPDKDEKNVKKPKTENGETGSEKRAG